MGKTSARKMDEVSEAIVRPLVTVNDWIAENPGPTLACSTFFVLGYLLGKSRA